MQTLLLASTLATALGGSLALGALSFHFNGARGEGRDVHRALEELQRRERAFKENCAHAQREMEAKRAELERLSQSAARAAHALNAAFNSLDVDARARSGSAQRYEFHSFEEPRSSGSRRKRA
ncbi:MAG: hypothetical protein Q4G03_08270 [Planctomycetia bacterium]|nr:hypothetical protein [Planctomycetia bacterium]